MSTTYFNRGTSNNSGSSPFHQLKPIPLLNKTNTEYFSTNNQVQKQGIDVWRVGAANNNFILNTSAQVRLRSINSNGTTTTISDTNATSYLASGEYSALHLNTADQCLYCLIENAPNYAVVKINDSSGVATAIGSSFTPATSSNWPDRYADDSPSMFINSSGNLEIIFKGVRHQLNKTTGAIISQDVPIVIGSYSTVGCDYVTADGSAASSHFVIPTTTQPLVVTIQRIVSSSSGVIESTQLDVRDLLKSSTYFNGNRVQKVIMVDLDKLYLGSISVASSGNPFGYIYRSDYDQMLQSIISWYTGS